MRHSCPSPRNRHRRLPSWFPCLLAGLLAAPLGSCTNGHHDAEDTASTAATVPTPTREEVLLIARMKNADREEVRQFIRDLLAEELPKDHPTPDYILRATTVQEASEAIGQRYPEFYLKQGNTLLEAVAAHPVRYRALIRDTRAMRAHFEGRSGTDSTTAN